MDRLKIIPLSIDGAAIFGQIKKVYKDKTGTEGKKLEKNNIDLMLASSAISENAVLVSNDNIFKVIKDIHHNFHFENWTKYR